MGFLRTTACFFFLLSTITINPSRAADYFMASTGKSNTSNSLIQKLLIDDSIIQGTGTRDNPWTKLEQALKQLQPSDTLFLMGGLYYEGNILWDRGTSSGLAHLPITITSLGDGEVVFDGEGKTSHAISISTENIVIKNITFRNYTRAGIKLISSENVVLDSLKIYGISEIAGIWVGFRKAGEIPARYSIIRNCVISGNGKTQNDHGIYLSWGSELTVIDGNTLSDNAGGGIHGWHSPATKHNKIFNNLISNNKWGIILAYGSTSNSIVNNTFVNNWDADIHLKYSGKTGLGVRETYIFNNLFLNHTKNGKTLKIGWFNANDVVIDYNWHDYPQGKKPILWESSSSSEPEEVTLEQLLKLQKGFNFSHSGEGDAGIRNLELGQYDLLPISPLLNRGVRYRFNYVSRDIQNNPRDLHPDIGAYEYFNYK